MILIMLAPLPFGMVYSITQAFFACAVLVLVIAYCFVRVRQGKGPAVSLRRIWPEAAGFILVLGWGFIQISTFTPEAWHHPLWAEAGAALGTELQGSISLARGAGFESIMRLITYGLVFFLALQWGRDRKNAARILWAVALAGTGYALYGLVIHLSGWESVLWVDKTRYILDLTGTFINRNSFATYLGLCLMCAAGLYLAEFIRAISSGRTGMDRLQYLVQQAFVRGSPILSCLLIIITGLFLTHSRAGVTASLAALSVLAILMGMQHKASRWLYKAVIPSLLIVTFFIFFSSGEGWLDRMTATDMEREGRLQVYEQTWQAAKQSPWLGYGLGSYEQTFLMFADTRTSNYVMAHNDWLEMIFELGIPAAIIWFGLLVSLSLRCLMGFFCRQRDRIYPAIGFCVCLLVGMHALVDFSLQIPAVAITFAVILGVGVAQSWSSVDNGW